MAPQGRGKAMDGVDARVGSGGGRHPHEASHIAMGVGVRGHARGGHALWRHEAGTWGAPRPRAGPQGVLQLQRDGTKAHDEWPRAASLTGARSLLPRKPPSISGAPCRRLPHKRALQLPTAAAAPARPHLGVAGRSRQHGGVIGRREGVAPLLDLPESLPLPPLGSAVLEPDLGTKGRG